MKKLPSYPPFSTTFTPLVRIIILAKSYLKIFLSLFVFLYPFPSFSMYIELQENLTNGQPLRDTAPFALPWTLSSLMPFLGPFSHYQGFFMIFGYFIHNHILIGWNSLKFVKGNKFIHNNIINFNNYYLKLILSIKIVY